MALTGLSRSRPLSVIGLPHYREKLFSFWPNDQVYEVGHPAPLTDPDILKTMVAAQIGYRARNPRKTLRNQVQGIRITDSGDLTIAAPKFLSEKTQEPETPTSSERRISDAEALINAALVGSTKAEVPVMYRNVEIKYSKFGVDDFDFK